MSKKRYRILSSRGKYIVQRLYFILYIIPYWYTWCNDDGDTRYFIFFNTIEEAEREILRVNKIKKDTVVKTITI